MIFCDEVSPAFVIEHISLLPDCVCLCESPRIFWNEMSPAFVLVPGDVVILAVGPMAGDGRQRAVERMVKRKNYETMVNVRPKSIYLMNVAQTLTKHLFWLYLANTARMACPSLAFWPDPMEM